MPTAKPTPGKTLLSLTDHTISATGRIADATFATT
jgi:hypothetical protein